MTAKISSRLFLLMINFPSPGEQPNPREAFFRRPVAHTGKTMLAVGIGLGERQDLRLLRRVGMHSIPIDF